MSKELIIKGSYDLAAPSQMASMAKVLQKHIIDQKLSTPISGKNYTNVEGWQFAGGLLGFMPKVVNVENLSSGTEKKWRADVELINIKTGVAVGNGSAICSNLENRKRSFDEYAIMSMAQTRAIGKAYRNLIGWVMKLAGYEATPSEEMVKMGETEAQGSKYTSQASKASQQAKSIPSEASKSPYDGAEAVILKVKGKLMALGARNEAGALKLLERKTGLKWTSFKQKTLVQAKGALTSLLNAK